MDKGSKFSAFMAFRKERQKKGMSHRCYREKRRYIIIAALELLTIPILVLSSRAALYVIENGFLRLQI